MPSAKHWCFTLNNYTDEDEPTQLPIGSSFYIAGREVGASGTRHLQGFISFVKRQTLSGARKVHPTAHWEVARDIAASIAYCGKDDRSPISFGVPPKGERSRSDLSAFKQSVESGLHDLDKIRTEHSGVYARYPRFCIEYLNQHRTKPEVPMYNLFGWQSDLQSELTGDPDDRSIIFICDSVGNCGKSYFANRYIQEFGSDAVVLEPGKKQDLAHIYATLPKFPRVVFYDCPRSKVEHMSYDFLEALKNGRMITSKYESRMIFFPVPHVVVFMNEVPDTTKLSSDRYVIRYIYDERIPPL